MLPDHIALEKPTNSKRSAQLSLVISDIVDCCNESEAWNKCLQQTGSGSCIFHPWFGSLHRQTENSLRLRFCQSAHHPHPHYIGCSSSSINWLRSRGLQRDLVDGTCRPFDGRWKISCCHHVCLSGNGWRCRLWSDAHICFDCSASWNGVTCMNCWPSWNSRISGPWFGMAIDGWPACLAHNSRLWSILPRKWAAHRRNTTISVFLRQKLPGMFEMMKLTWGRTSENDDRSMLF